MGYGACVGGSVCVGGKQHSPYCGGGSGSVTKSPLERLALSREGTVIASFETGGGGGGAEVREDDENGFI